MLSSRSRGRLKRSCGVAGALAFVLAASTAVAVSPSAAMGESPQDVARTALPPGPEPAEVVPPDELRLPELARHDTDRDHRALADVKHHTQPYVFTDDAHGGDRVLVLPPAAHAYDLADVARRAPSSFRWLSGHRLVLEDSLVVAPGAALVVDSSTVASLLLASDATGYRTIRLVYSALTLQGHPGRTLLVSSIDRATGRTDGDRSDGRAYILDLGGRLLVNATQADSLGFASTGMTSGVAWAALDGRAATGGARGSTFIRNYFGAYTAGAERLRFDRTAFLHNIVYGFDPHTGTTDTLVTHSRAEFNGRHGIIFSEGCSRNVVRDSTASGNGGAGFMIDDGAIGSGLGRPSDGNRFIRVSAHDNAQAGVIIEGGTGNTVEDSRTSGEAYGIWVRNEAAETRLSTNHITDAGRAAIRLGPGLGETEVAGNLIRGGPIAIRSEGGSATWISGGQITDVTRIALRLDGDQQRTRFSDLSITAPHAHEVELRGVKTTIDELTHPARGSSVHSTHWSLVSMLHRLVFVLWALILLPTIVTRLGSKRLRTVT